MSDIRRNILLNPGPATTSDSVKRALVVPDVCPREQEFKRVLRLVRDGLTEIVNGGESFTTVLLAGSGTAAMDACINSVVPPQGRVAIVNNGAYGERLVKIARAYSIPVCEIASPWDEPLDVDAVRRQLERERDVTTLAMVHHETTTGLLNPIFDVARVARTFGCTVVVDSISSFAAIPIDLQAHAIDFLISTSNKCIQGMAGLAFVIARRAALERLRDYPPRSFYLNLYQQHKNFERTGEMQFTPPVQVVYALQQAIRELHAEGGVAKRHERYSENMRILRRGLIDLGFELLLPEPIESRVLLTVKQPQESWFDFMTLHDRMLERGFTIYPGKLGDRPTFRLAVMGDLRGDDIRGFLAALAEELDGMKIAAQPSAGGASHPLRRSEP